MKIGVLTFHRPSNFGANLQAYSTTKYFQSLGHEVMVIDYVRPIDLEYNNRVDSKQYDAHKHFVETNLPLTKQVMDEDGLCDVVSQEGFDLVLIGADAVWRSPKDNCIYFAKWLFENKDCENISVASISPAHMGDGYQNQDEQTRNTIKACLQKFKYITVRDKWTMQVINRDIFGGEPIVKHVNPDPVVMLSDLVGGKAWSSDIKPKSYYLMSLPKDWCNNSRVGSKRRKWFGEFKLLVNKFGYKLVELPIPEGKSGLEFDYVVDYPVDPLQWFLWIKNAKAFCGLRFHAIVSSISNGTSFYSVDSYAENSRMTKVLDLLGLHTLARKRDKSSKIRNLLEGTTFEAFRTGAYLEFESPRKVFEKMEYAKHEEIVFLRDSLKEIFVRNMSEMLKSIE